ncbi:MAG TPA: hypothetical protein VFT53_07385 [Candidatus Saccharimonadales bacterium]|nr:hypothetical protein [Candidatus Saccharimonadales bacterium]
MRGKQYELDTPRSNLNTIIAVNGDGLFDQYNTSSLFYPQLNAQNLAMITTTWPAKNVNLLEQQYANAGDFYRLAAFFSQQNGTTIGYQTTTFMSGGGALVSVYPNSSASGTRGWMFGFGACTPGTQYTFSTYAAVSAGTQGFAVTAVCYSATPTLLSTNTGSTVTVGTSFSRLSVTFTPPAGTIAVGFYIACTSITGSINLYTDQLQLEVGSSPTAWTAPNTTYPIGGGYIESIEHSYSQTTLMPVVTITLDDVMGVLSQTLLGSAVYNQIQLLQPSAYYTLGDNSNSTAAGATTNPLTGSTAAPAQVVSHGGGSGVKFGDSSLISTCQSDSSVTFDNTAVSGVSWSAIELQSQSVGQPGVKMSTVGGVNSAMVLWFQAGSGITNQQLFCQQNADTTGIEVNLWINTVGQLEFDLASSSSSVDVVTTGATSYNDGLPHWAAINIYNNNTRANLYVDGTLVTDFARGGSHPVIGSVPVTAQLGNNISGGAPLVGSLQHFAIFTGTGTSSTAILTSTNIGLLQTAQTNAFAGESTSQRFTRIIANSQQNVGYLFSDFGGYQNVGGLTDSSGQSVIQALNLDMQDEQANYYVSPEGSFFRVEARHDRWRNVVPNWTVGDAPGEIPYLSDVKTEFDDVRVVNFIQATKINGTVQQLGDATSIKAHFLRSYPGSLTLKALSDNDVNSILQGIIWRYKNPMERIAQIKFSSIGNTIDPNTQWPFLLGAKISDRIRYNRRPFGSPGSSRPPTRSLDNWIESIQHTIDFTGQTPAWTMVLECSIGLPGNTSPGLSSNAWIPTAARTTLKTSTIVGATTFVVNALPDAATITSQQDGWTVSSIPSISFQDGANSEILPVSSISTTTTGYTQFTITTSSGALFSHGAGAIVNETVKQPNNTGRIYNTFDTVATTDTANNVVVY